MRMQHQFTVPVPVDVAWPALLDPERVAPCMPGATLTHAEGNEFAGSVKVRLGPISLLYKGKGTFSDVDADARRVVIDASGKDSRGSGTASATVTAVLTDGGDRTSVTVDTDLKVTGKPAQLGRGLISEVGGKIITQFSECLAGRLSGQTSESGESGAASAAAGSTAKSAQGKSAQGKEKSPQGEDKSAKGENKSAKGENKSAQGKEKSAKGEDKSAKGEEKSADGSGTAEPASTPSGGPNGERTAAADGNNGGKPASSASAGKSAGGRPVGRRPAWRMTPPADESAEVAAASSTAKEVPSGRADAVVTGERMPSGEAIDLLGTAGAPVLKRALPIAGALVAVVLLLRKRRRRRRA